MLEAVILFACQVAFLYARTASIRYTANGSVAATVSWSVVIALLWVVTAAYGVEAILEGNYLMILVYALGAGVGTYAAMKLHIDKESE